MIDLYVSPSTQPGNPVTGGGTEQSVQYEIGKRLAANLRARGVTVHLSEWKREGEYVNAGIESNRLGARYHHALHSDASGSPAADWTHSIVVPGAGEASRAAWIIQDELTREFGWPNRGVVTRTDLFELNETTAHAVLTESGFHTNPAQARMLREHPDRFADAYTRAWLRILGVSDKKGDDEEMISPETQAWLVEQFTNDQKRGTIAAVMSVQQDARAKAYAQAYTAGPLAQLVATLAQLDARVERLEAASTGGGSTLVIDQAALLERVEMTLREVMKGTTVTGKVGE